VTTDTVPAPGAPSADSKAPILQVRDLTVEFFVDGEWFPAAVDVSYDVHPGEVLAIVGESGSGKTTIARMIVGLVAPTSGTIRACGRDRSQPAARASARKARGREIQIVFQDPYTSLDPRQSARGCVAEAVALHQTRTGRDPATRVDELFEMVGLSPRVARAKPDKLSGGQRQRVAIARALAAEPRLLILDESVAALDVSIQAQVLNILMDIRDGTGMSYLLISHDLAVVRQLCEDAIVLRKGQVVEARPTCDVLDHPTHPYTRHLRASVPGPGWTLPEPGQNSLRDESAPAARHDEKEPS
jgi:ABC-type glutathione transport system ATPase component